MRPFTVLIGIVLGSAASITFSLCAVLVVFAILTGTGRDPSLAQEFPRLLGSLCAFAALTATSAGSFLGQARVRPWRGWAHAATLAALALIVLLYWPRRV